MPARAWGFKSPLGHLTSTKCDCLTCGDVGLRVMLECELDPWFRWWFQTALSPVWRTTGPAVIIVTMSELSDARMRSGAARDNVERLLGATPETDMNAEQRTKLEAAEAAVVRLTRNTNASCVLSPQPRMTSSPQPSSAPKRSAASRWSAGIAWV